MRPIPSHATPMHKYRSSVKNRHPVMAARNGVTGGFTLIELMVTLAVGAILLAMAVPSFRTFVQNAQVNNTADSFLAAIQRARSEAITRGDTVVLCRTADPSSDTCSGSSDKDWTPGWLMYTVASGSEENFQDNSENELISRGRPAPEGVEITSDVQGNQWLAFGGDGSLKEDNTVAYAICDTDRGEEAGRLIVIPMMGRPYLTDDLSDAPGCVPN